MATYNRAELIGESLKSIIGQTFNDWECIVVEDGGSDNTREILTDLNLRESRINYFVRPSEYKKGLPGCRNFGLDRARGEYIVFFDDDDIVHPQLFEICVKEIQECSVDYCRYLRETFTGNFHYNFDYNESWEVRKLGIQHVGLMVTGDIPFNSCQVLWSKDCFNGKRFVEELMYAEEWELYSRILSEGRIGISIEKVLYYGRKHAKSNTGEYKLLNPVRVKSHIKAALLVIENLSSKKLFDQHLKNFFVRLGFILKEPKIISRSLKASGAGKLEILKYGIGYKFYPVIKPIFGLKNKIRKS